MMPVASARDGTSVPAGIGTGFYSDTVYERP